MSKTYRMNKNELLAKDVNMDVVGFIPARGGSKGIDNKNLVMLAGYPLVAHAILILKAAGIRKIYISTDSEQIAKVSKKYGAEVIIRPRILARDDSPTEDAINHFVSVVKCDAVAFMQCTSPMLEPNYVRNAINKIKINDIDSIFTAVNTKGSDLLLWNRYLKPINYSPTARGRRQTRSTYFYIETGGLYVFRTKTYKKHKCRICGKYDIEEVPFYQSLEIDDLKDLNVVRKIMER